MKKCYVLFLIIVLNSVFAVPDVDASAVLGNDATCDETSLDITDLSADLHAEWEPNTVNLKYYNDGVQYGDVYSCEYDDFVQIPPQPQDKHGYVFAGWQVVQSQQQQQCSLNSVWTSGMADEEPDWDSTHMRWKPIDTVNGYTMTDAGMAQENSNDLNPGEWAVLFNSGEIKGRALCSTTNGTRATVDTPDETGGGQYCWCAGTSFEPVTGSTCNVAAPSWVFRIGNFYGNAASCARNCANRCAGDVRKHSVYRRAVFGVTE